MNKTQRQISQVTTACVQDNQILALSVNTQDIDRCTKIIRQYGLLTPPVVGSFSDGTQLLLSGECEFLALRELGAKSVEAITVQIEEENEGKKLSLLLSSLKKSPNALSEGIMISQIFKTGKYTQSQLGDLLGKSVSWINKRISLATRLRPSVQELVTQRQLCPHSAQEISRLPEEVQHDFSVKVIKEGIPKSSVESLVAAFNAKSCPDEIRKQIVENPRETMQRLADVRSAKAVPAKLKYRSFTPSVDIKENFVELRRYLGVFSKYIYGTTIEEMNTKLIKELREELAVLIKMIDQTIPFSSGKNTEEAVIYGN